MHRLLARFGIPILSALAGVSTLDAQLPDGKGKEVVETTCTECHTLERVRAQRRDEEGWNAILREMLESGAQIETNDIKTIVDYLSQHFGPDAKVNVNTAFASEIAGVLKLDASAADAIVAYRTRNGRFHDVAELEKASGVPDKIEAKKTLIEF